MKRFIGMDGHDNSCTFVVLDSNGRVKRKSIVETNGQALVEFVKTVPGRRHLCLEEGTQSQWFYEILSPHVHDIAIHKACEIDARLAPRIGHAELAGRRAPLGKAHRAHPLQVERDQVPREPIAVDVPAIVAPRLAKRIHHGPALVIVKSRIQCRLVIAQHSENGLK